MTSTLKTTMLVAGVASSIGLAGLGGLGLASADTAGSSQDSLVTRIAKKFNLKESDVKAVFDEDRAAHQAQAQQTYENRLNLAVSQGKLTGDQKDKLLAKQKESQQQREADESNTQSKTPEERRADMQTQRQQLEQWAKDNNIPTQYLFFGHGHPGGHHRMGM